MRRAHLLSFLLSFVASLAAHVSLHPIQSFKFPKGAEWSPGRILVEPDRLTISAFSWGADEQGGQPWIWDGRTAQLLRHPEEKEDGETVEVHQVICCGGGGLIDIGPRLSLPMKPPGDLWEPSRDTFLLRGENGLSWGPRAGWGTVDVPPESLEATVRSMPGGALSLCVSGRDPWLLDAPKWVPDLKLLPLIPRIVLRGLGYEQVAISLDGDRAFTVWWDFEPQEGRIPYRKSKIAHWAAWQRGISSPRAEGDFDPDSACSGKGSFQFAKDGRYLVAKEGNTYTLFSFPELTRLGQADGYLVNGWPDPKSILLASTEASGEFALLCLRPDGKVARFRLDPSGRQDTDTHLSWQCAGFSPDGCWMALPRLQSETPESLELFDLSSVINDVP